MTAWVQKESVTYTVGDHSGDGIGTEGRHNPSCKGLYSLSIFISPKDSEDFSGEKRRGSHHNFTAESV